MNRDRVTSDDDRMLLFALVRASQILSEAASKVSSETREIYPDLPSRAITAMHNRLIRACCEIDRDISWKTAVEEIPALITFLHAADRRLLTIASASLCQAHSLKSAAPLPRRACLCGSGSPHLS